MAIIRVKRGTTTPTTSNLTNIGELAFDYSKDELFVRGSSSVVKIGGELERVYYYEGNVSYHAFDYSFNRDYIYKVHVIAATNGTSVDSSSSIISYKSGSNFFSGSYVSSMINDVNSTVTKTSARNAISFIVNDAYSNSVSPSYAITKVLDFEISPTFEYSYQSTYQWVAYGTSITTVSDQANAPITYSHFAHSVDANLAGIQINPGLTTGSVDAIAITVYRMKRK